MSPVRYADHARLAEAITAAAGVSDRAQKIVLQVQLDALSARGVESAPEATAAAYGTRVAPGEPGVLVTLWWLRALARDAGRLEGILVGAARDGGASWAEIGTALGITKQSAHQKFGSGKTGRTALPEHTEPLW